MTAATWLRRTAALAAWAFAVWLLLTWTATLEQLVFGAVLAVIVGMLIAPLGDVAPPWRLLDPRRLFHVLVLLGACVLRIVRANAVLSWRIWAPGRHLRSGMVVVPTDARTDGELAAVGLITSLIVDNQIVDLDRRSQRLQYHAVAVPAGDTDSRADVINRPVERLVAALVRRN